MTCPNCSSQNHTQKVVPCKQFIGAEVPIRHCNACGEEWEDVDTFNARGAIWAERHKRGLEDEARK